MRRLLRACAALMLLGCDYASAADDGPLHARFTLDLGTYWMNSDTTVRADEIDGFRIGLPLDLEDTFGFEEQTVFRVEGAWRFRKRHKLRLMYFDSDRLARAASDEEIRFDGVTYPVGLEVTAEFNFNIMELAYEYEFLQRERYEMGASIGIHHVSLMTRLIATASLPDASASGTLRGEIETDVPLPVVGLCGTWNFLGDFYLQGQAQYFQMKYEGYDGSLREYRLGVLWQLSRHLGIGTSYNSFITEVDIDDGRSFQGRLDWRYSGVQAYVSLAF